MDEWIILIIECAIFCGIFWLICFLGTGSESKNLANLSSYPKRLQNLIRKDERYKDKIKRPTSLLATFLSNLLLFTAIEFIFGIFIRSKNYTMNFVYLLILGEFTNLFDLLVIDLCWWRNSKRIRFEGFENKDLYKNMRLHFYSFLRAIPLFVIVAAVDAGFLILF